MYIYIYIHICIQASKHSFIHVCMYVCAHACTHACMYVFSYTWHSYVLVVSFWHVLWLLCAIEVSQGHIGVFRLINVCTCVAVVCLPSHSLYSLGRSRHTLHSP